MKLKQVNRLLLALIIIVNGYIIAAPTVPALLFRIEKHSGARQQALVHKAQTLSDAAAQKRPAAVPTTNELIIPSMLLDSQIYEAKVQTTLGVWRRASSSTPDAGGNTVIVGHRYTYNNPRGVLYSLNAVKVGDEATVVWKQKVYTYKVVTISEVNPDQTSVEANTAQPEITVYTCTPVWNPKHRLVVVADLEHAS